MSYNGVGLQTPRGSGTSGYVQKNVATKKLEGFREKRARDEAETQRRETKQKMHEARRSAGQEVKEHLDKRKIEVKCMELRDRLEDEDVEEADIENQVAALREKLVAQTEKIHECSDKESDGKQAKEGLQFHSLSRRELVQSEERAKSADQKAKTVEGGKPEKADDKVNKEFAKETKESPTEKKVVAEALALDPAFQYVPRYKSR